MARTTKPPQFSFDDSLVILPKRQTPVTQTPRGNYEWSWLQADCYVLVEGVPTALGKTDRAFTTAPAYSDVEFLVFGADVPHLAMYSATEAGQGAFNSDLKAWLTDATAFLEGVQEWGEGLPPGADWPADLVVPTPPEFVPNLCTSRTSVAIRPSALSAVWGVTSDAGQGALVSCEYPNAAGETTFVQGFPLQIVDLVCSRPTPPATFTLENLILTVGFESGVNHGLGHAESTNTTRGYTPIVLYAPQYSPAIYAAGNIIDAGSLGLFYVVGLWYVAEVPA
jgi:hypothetical protein